jgi:hypothetical protein
LGADARWPVRAFALAFLCFTLFTLWQALAGIPFMPSFL